MKLRKGWKIIWPDGTEWLGDCPRWAAVPLAEGTRIIPIRIVGTGHWPCAACLHGMRH